MEEIDQMLFPNYLQKRNEIEMSGRTGLDKGSNIKLIMERNNIRSVVYIGDT